MGNGRANYFVAVRLEVGVVGDSGRVVCQVGLAEPIEIQASAEGSSDIHCPPT